MHTGTQDSTQDETCGSCCFRASTNTSTVCGHVVGGHWLLTAAPDPLKSLYLGHHLCKNTGTTCQDCRHSDKNVLKYESTCRIYIECIHIILWLLCILHGSFKLLSLYFAKKLSSKSLFTIRWHS